MRRRILLAVAVVLLVPAGVAALLARQGGYERYDFSAGRPPAGAPSWTASCIGGQVGRAGTAEGCIRIRGRVLWREHEQEAGDVPETHLIVIAHWHFHVVKVQKRPGAPHVPSLGSFITAVGAPVRGSHGETEVYAFRIHG